MWLAISIANVETAPGEKVDVKLLVKWNVKRIHVGGAQKICSS